tara:strand:- start:632 stop:1012 length:381 start_codon:yes stop_codon:yes gene_type:complete
MRFLILLAIVYLIIVFQSDWTSDFNNHITSQKYFTYHEPESRYSNAVNHYTVIHFIQYAAVSFVKLLKLWHIALFSVIWEIFELFTHYEWGRESWLNKIIDIVFNILGFQLGRSIMVNLLNKKPSL